MTADIGIAGPTLLRQEAARLDREQIHRKWGLLGADGRPVNKDGTFVEIKADQLRFAAVVLEQLAYGEQVASGALVPDLPCPKCGSGNVTIEHCFERPPSSQTARDDQCARSHGPEIEHFHRACERCRYRWRTDDVLTPTSLASTQ